MNYLIRKVEIYLVIFEVVNIYDCLNWIFGGKKDYNEGLMFVFFVIYLKK